MNLPAEEALLRVLETGRLTPLAAVCSPNGAALIWMFLLIMPCRCSQGSDETRLTDAGLAFALQMAAAPFPSIRRMAIAESWVW